MLQQPQVAMHIHQISGSRFSQPISHLTVNEIIGGPAFSSSLGLIIYGYVIHCRTLVRIDRRGRSTDAVRFGTLTDAEGEQVRSHNRLLDETCVLRVGYQTYHTSFPGQALLF